MTLVATPNGNGGNGGGNGRKSNGGEHDVPLKVGTAMWELIRFGWMTKGGQEASETDLRRIHVLTSTIDQGFQALMRIHMNEVPDVDDDELRAMSALRLVHDERVPEGALRPAGRVRLGVREGHTVKDGGDG